MTKRANWGFYAADMVTGNLVELFDKCPIFTFELDRDAVELVEKQLLKDQFG